MRHCPIEEVVDNVREINGAVASQRQRLEQIENVSLVPTSLARQIAQIELTGVKNDGVALIEQISIGRGHAVGDFAAGLDKRLLAKAEYHVGSVVIARPVQDSFRF